MYLDCSAGLGARNFKRLFISVLISVSLSVLRAWVKSCSATSSCLFPKVLAKMLVWSALLFMCWGSTQMKFEGYFLLASMSMTVK